MSRALAAFTALSLAAATPLAAQPRWERVADPMRGSRVFSRSFLRASGLISGSAYIVSRDPRGRIWIGAEDGPYASAGGQWQLERLPPTANHTQIRDIVFDANQGRWYAMRTGAYQFAEGRWRAYTEKQGVPGDVVYSLAETRAIDGRPRMVLGARKGVCYVDGDRCILLKTPTAISQNAFIVRNAHAADGSDELWVASAGGGAARLRGGTWTAFAEKDGLLGSSEDLAIGASTEDVLVSGGRGVFRLTRLPDGRERFILIDGSPRGAYRVAWVPNRLDRHEFWVGTSSGIVLSWSNQRWDSVRFESDAVRGQVTVLRAVVDSNDTQAVYVGTRGGRVARLTFNSARAFHLPGRAARDFVNDIVQWPRSRLDGSAILVSLASGTAAIDSSGRVRPFGDALDTLVSATTRAYWGLLGHAPAGGSPRASTDSLMMLGHAGPIVLHNKRWMSLPHPRNTQFFDIDRLELLDGSSAVVAATSNGPLVWDDSVWTPLARAPDDFVTTATSVRSGDTRKILLGARGGVYTMTNSGVRFDTIVSPGQNLRPNIRFFCEVPRASGNIMVASGDDGALAWRRSDADGQWHSFSPSFLTAIGFDRGVVISCDTSDRLFVGSSMGVLVADVRDADPARWRITALVASEDGLPADLVTSIGRPFDERLWVGTEFGPAIVDLTHATLPPPVPLVVRLSGHASSSSPGEALTDLLTLAPTDDQLRVDAWLDTYHRELDSRFLVEWRREDDWWTPTRPTAPTAEQSWSELGTRFITGISPGTYVLRVRGRDFAGRETTPYERRITMRSPWWRAWPALLSYVLALATMMWLAYRWRVKVLQRGTAGLVQSERRLRESEGRFRALFEGALDAHLLVESGRIVGANAAAATLFGTETSAALIGRTAESLLPINILAAPVGAPTEHTISRGAAVVPVQLTITEIVLEGGTLHHVVLRDLTEARAAERSREKMEAHLRERQRLEALGTLAGGVAHDFNNLLGVIRGNAELADLSGDDAEATHEHLASIVDASDRARDLVRQILTFSSSPLPRQERTDLSMLLRSLLPLLRRMIPSSISIVLEGVERPHIIDGDPAQLQQVLLNLASNAEYSMRERAAGTLTISVLEEVVDADGPPPVGRVIRLSVRDTGVGMSSTVRERVFEPFFTTKPTGEGTGLGMAVLHGVVVAHRGRVQLTSTPNVGTTVDVVFPRASGADGGVRPDAVSATATTRSAVIGANLVIVDDEPGVASVLERALTRIGHRVRVFADPTAALAAIQAAPDAVDLLLTDQTMPVMTGDVLAEQVRAVCPTLPVLILTGFSHRLTPERLAEVRAVAVLQKPIALDALYRAVAMALDPEANAPATEVE